MLVLSRRPNEKLVLPTVDVAVQVVKILGNVVRLGIEAPDHVAVYREELLRNRAASNPPGGACPARPAPGAAEGQAPSSLARNQWERVLDGLGSAFEFAQAALARGETQEARRVLEKALRQVAFPPLGANA